MVGNVSLDYVSTVCNILFEIKTSVLVYVNIEKDFVVPVLNIYIGRRRTEPEAKKKSDKGF